jgi:hypothetical protein
MSRQEQPQKPASTRPPRLQSVDSARDSETIRIELGAAVEAACARQHEDWPAKVAAAICAALEFAADEQVGANVLTVESLALGNGDLAHQRGPVDRLAQLLAAGREENPEGETLPGLLEEALAGAILMLIVQRVEVGHAKTLPALAPDAIEFALTPYIGRDRARDVATAKR